MQSLSNETAELSRRRQKLRELTARMASRPGHRPDPARNLDRNERSEDGCPRDTPPAQLLAAAADLEITLLRSLAQRSSRRPPKLL